MNPRLTIFFLAIFAMAGFGAISPLIFRDYKPGTVSQLPIVGDAPEFELRDSDNNVFRSNMLEGQVRVFNFFFSTCHGPCPQMTSHLQLIYRAFQRDNRVHLVSTSVNPEDDTPEVLKTYAEKLHADTNRWHFLTGEQEAIRSMMTEGFHLGTTDDPAVHTTRFVLVDRLGKIRGYYHGTEKEDVERLKIDIEKLLKVG